MPFIPGFTLLRRHIRRENFRTDAFFRKDVPQAVRHVAFLRVNGKDLGLSALRQFVSDLLQQAPLLGVLKSRIEILRLRNDEPLSLSCFLVSVVAVECAQAIRPVRV
jgi:hypothetical protein